MQRPYPRAIEAEQALLGGLIQSPHRLEEVYQDKKLRSDDFHRPEHRKLFQLLVEMSKRNEAIDMISVPERVTREGRQDEYGGFAYLVELGDNVPATANLGHYATVIREKALLRRLLEAMHELSDGAFANPEDPAQYVAEAALRLREISQEVASGSWEQITTVLDRRLQELETLAENPGDVTGYDTGFIELNKKLAGFQPTDLIILAARPAMGKTALALNFTKNVALNSELPVGMFSLEMSRSQLVTRILSSEALVEGNRLRTGRLDQEHWDALLAASDERLSRAKIFIDDTPGLSVSEVHARCRRLAAEHGQLGLVVIDYLQLMSGEGKDRSREQEISNISRGLKQLAKDLNVPVLALSQLNRGVESRADKRPMPSDLRESGAIEQDADIIMFIYRDEVYNPETPDKGLAEVIIAKQRGGSTGTVKLVFQGQYTLFSDYYAESAGAGPLI